MDVTNTFSSIEAAALFERYTGFVFHSSVPGTLLARRGIVKLPISGRPSRFDASNWRVVWDDMLALAQRRCEFDSTLAPPRHCPVPALGMARPLPKETSLSRMETMAQTDLEPVVEGPLLSKRFIDVKWADKDEAAGAGAKWDWKAKMWYLPPGIELAHSRWPEIIGSSSKSVSGVKRRGETRSTIQKSGKNKMTRNYSLDALQRDSDERLVHLLSKDD